MARSVNTAQVVANWLIGREIVEDEQKGKRRAGYGRKLIEKLSRQISQGFGSGYSVQSLFYMKQFYLAYPALLPGRKILHAVHGKSNRGSLAGKLHAVRGESARPLALMPFVTPDNWSPGHLHSTLSKLHLPSEAELRAELRRELKHLRTRV